MNTYLFVNPASGHHTARNFQLVLEKLHAGAVFPEILEVRTPAEIYTFCNRINNKSENPLIIVAGGDGTFNAVVNGLKPGTATLAVLPFGTSNVLAAEIGITSIDDGLERIIAGKTASLSVGILETGQRSLRFVLMAGIGLDGAVVRDVWPLGKKFLRQAAYALSTLKHALAWDSSFFEVCTSKTLTECHTAIVCNASRYGGDFVLSPGNNPFSPGLSAICITGNTRCTYLNAALSLFRGKAVAHEKVVRIQSSSFEIKGSQPIQIDGDFVGYGPARISELNDFARMII